MPKVLVHKLQPGSGLFRTPFLYRRVRHPIYLSFLLAFWATPTMTAGHLLFALAITAYILLGINLEERNLVALFGDRYRVYQKQVGMLIPRPGRRIANRSTNPETQQTRDLRS